MVEGVIHHSYLLEPQTIWSRREAREKYNARQEIVLFKYSQFADLELANEGQFFLSESELLMNN